MRKFQFSISVPEGDLDLKPTATLENVQRFLAAAISPFSSIGQLATRQNVATLLASMFPGLITDPNWASEIALTRWNSQFTPARPPLEEVLRAACRGRDDLGLMNSAVRNGGRIEFNERRDVRVLSEGLSKPFGNVPATITVEPQCRPWLKVEFCVKDWSLVVSAEFSIPPTSKDAPEYEVHAHELFQKSFTQVLEFFQGIVTGGNTKTEFAPAAPAPETTEPALHA